MIQICRYYFTLGFALSMLAWHTSTLGSMLTHMDYWQMLVAKKDLEKNKQ